VSAPVPEQDVAAALATALSRTLAPATGCSVFVGNPRSPVEPGLGDNDSAIWVAPAGGAGATPPAPYLNAAASGSRYVGGLRVWVISKANKWLEGIALARAARDAVHTKDQAIGAAYCLALASSVGEPDTKGRNEGQQHRFFFDLKLSWTYRN